MEKNLLIIGTTWPEPKATAAGGRMQRLIGFFLGVGYQITFASTANESPLSMDLESIGIRKQQILLNHSSFDEFLKELHPDLVLFDRFPMEEQFGWRVAEFAPKALRILDTEDLHSLRKTREIAFRENTPWTPSYWQQADITKREISSIYRCDLSLIISSFEMKLLQDTLKIDTSLLLHLPFMVDPISDETRAEWPSFERRTDFLFIGTGMHAPNLDAIKWLKTEIWPLIRAALPLVNCHIYGSYFPERIKQMHRPQDGFYVDGAVEDVTPILQHKRINLAPLRFGAGLKGKLISGMLNGTPNITSPIGAEGMHGVLPWNGRIATTAVAFANAAIALYTNHTEWKEAQKNGVTLINSLYNSAAHQKNLLLKLESMANDLPVHRNRNFIGSLLQHQTLASTKYMSKWIAEKNRK